MVLYKLAQNTESKLLLPVKFLVRVTNNFHFLKDFAV